MDEGNARLVAWRVMVIALLLIGAVPVTLAGAASVAGSERSASSAFGDPGAAGDPTPATAFITSTTPGDGAVGIALNASIIITFSEPVSPTNVSVSILPSLALNSSWAGTTLTLTHANLFAQCTIYTVEVSGVLPGPVANPFSFRTFCPNPVIVSTSPADGAVDVALSANIVVTFDKAMAPSTVTWTITGGILLNGSWNVPTNTILSLHHYADFSACTLYTVQITGSDAAGLPLVPGPVSNPFSFRAGVCLVQLRSPTGGEDWTGGSIHQIIWDQASPSGADLGWTLDWLNGTAWERIANGTAGNGTQTYLWTVPLVDRTDARVRVCAGPPTGYLNCSTSGPFTIDSTAPFLVSHDPPDGALDVPVTMFLTAVFSETMNQAATERAFTSSPPAFVLSTSWPDPKTIVLQLEGLRTATRYVWSFGCTATDISSWGNPLADCTATHDFSTEGGTPVSSVSLLSPRGGESWTGGSTHNVRFTVDNRGPVTDVFSVNATFRYAGGTQTGSVGVIDLTVPAGVALDGQISWVVPRADALDAIVNVTATNRTGARFWDESLAFEIDSTPPQVSSFSPSGPGVKLDAVITVMFTEPMAVPAPPSVALTIAPTVALAVQWRSTRDALTASPTALLPCTTYTVTLAALRDDSDPGNPLPSPAPISWSFSTICSPTVALLAPDGGEDWTGGSMHTIRWVTSDPDDPTLTIDLSFSLDGGADGFSGVIAGPLVVTIGGGSYAWTLPRADSSRVLVRITATDSAGNAASDTSAAVFTIDSTPPALLVSFPADGASGHKTTRDLWFVWTERVDRASFATAFGLSPNPGGLGLEWSVSNLGGDVLLVTHDPMRSRTTYAATFSATAKDDSDPGNFLAGPVVVRFTTQPPPPVNPPVALAVGHNQIEVGEPTTFDGTGSTGDIRDYVWRIADNHGGFVGVLVGSLATYTFQQQGRYSVTLFVTDVNGVVDDDTIEIAVTSNPHSDGLIAAGAAGAALAAAALIAGTEGGKLAAFQFFLFPLYARRKRDELLDHETRGMIRGYILVHPGDSYSDIRRNLALSNGTLSYHLTVLEREGIVHSQTRGSRKLFYPREARLPNDGGGMHEVQIRMLRAIEQIPGLAVTDLAGALGITSQLALYHLRALAQEGRIRFERRGLRLRCFAQMGGSEDTATEASVPKD
ncbi:MAG: winged helix-turn-helix transcriptional regulator [Methanobacteriota archaeon]|nr:MAG: winged helix-turn-helix transcriptional regulator [Euryarchaeota archaeon]